MMFRIFNIAIPNDGSVESELNHFLASHKIVSVRTQWVTNEATPYLVFVVEYVGANKEASSSLPNRTSTSERVDYRKELTPEQFVRYCKMRDIRKQIADEEAVKPFVVFTNEQLAAISRLESPSLAALSTIDGVGNARITRYGVRILASLQASEVGVDELGQMTLDGMKTEKV